MTLVAQAWTWQVIQWGLDSLLAPEREHDAARGLLTTVRAKVYIIADHRDRRDFLDHSSRDGIVLKRSED